ncbi:efflux RND transporter permease subunit [Engelhardtia mirabilis]|uniref:Nickel and cobalt resistance protein CnrA n=1 Tax=Engelhardtia mirabilis TaxID=2528011 RepID=A0A518BIT8_9BACT|nr:Nickel and cobalt resistance protein CnrA [Planctomycetes bacterium Pla133]QDV01201.1 Nickel and cobalt resistance protein CnrA [Planctomycetes bacterium Pla86]
MTASRTEISHPAEATPGGWRTLFFRNPRLMFLALALIVVSGLSSYELLPRREDPELTGRFATVITRLPGASAERVESLVTEKLEEALQDVEEINLLESDSRTGISTLIVELADEVLEVDEVWSRVRDRLSGAEQELPTEASKPVFDEQEVDAKALIAAVVWNGAGPAPRGVMSRLAEDLEDRLRALPGTKETEILGDSEEEILVEIDPARLASLGLSMADLSSLVADDDSKVSAGRLHAVGSEVALEVTGDFDSLARVRDAIVATGPAGQVVRLGDVAQIEKTVADPPRDLAWIDGRPGVTVGAILENTVRVDRWAARARETVAEFKAELSGSIGVEVIFDQSGYTEQRLDNLFANLGLGALLVVLSLLVMMGWRSAVLVGLALPLTTLMVLQGMRTLGVPIHQMSVTGLIIALGLLIDNAIVMVDEVRHELDQGHSPGAAVNESVRRLFVPLLGSTLTTVLAFMPIVLMPGPAGEFVGAIGITVSLALISSLFLSVTVIASFTALMARASRLGETPSWWHRGVHSAGLLRVYRGFLTGIVKRPLLGVGMSFVLPILGWAAMPRLQEQFFPPTDRDQFQVQMWLPQQSDIDETSAAVAELRRVALEHPDVAAVHAFVGASSPKFYYNIPEGTEGAAFYAQALIQLRGARGAQRVALDLQRELDAALPHVQTVVRLLEQGPPFDAPVEVQISGPDVERLDQLGRELRGILASVPGVVHTRTTVAADRPKLWFEADDLQLSRTGLDRVALARALEGLLDGRLGGSLLEASEELPVRVRLRDQDRADLASIQGLPLQVRSADGAPTWTSLAALGEVRLEPELASIRRRNGERENSVQGYLEAGILPSAGLEGFLAALDAAGFEAPPGYTLTVGGESAERDEAIGNLMAFVGLLLVVMVAVLVLSFNSFRMAAIIGAVGLFSTGLSTLALYAFGFPFGFMAIIGTMGLIGVAINDSIVVLAAIRDDLEARTGDAAAIVRVVVRSTRHVLSTTITTMAGFTPLIIAGGQFWPPLAVALGFGVVGATILALAFVPCTYRMLHRERPRFARRSAPIKTRAEVPTPAVG